MLNLSYTVSPKLKTTLDNIDRARAKVLLLRLPREDQAEIAWRAKLARTYYSLSMSGNKLPRRDMAAFLSDTTIDNKQKLTKEQSEVLHYFYTQDYINQIWYMNSKNVTPETVYQLYAISSQATFGDSKREFDSKTGLLKQLLDYISQGDDHAVIKAGIIQMQLRLISPFVNANGRITRLLSQLFLYKEGYDVRGFLVLDEYWKKNIGRYRQEVEVASQSENMTGWLEFYADAFEEVVNKSLEVARGDRKVPGVQKSFWELNRRQKQILSLLENPSLSLTNDDVQKKFNVSQVTASRDFAKLLKLDLVFRHGKGRSVYYTRV